METTGAHVCRGGVHERNILIGTASHLSAVEVGGECHVALRSKVVRELTDAIDEAVPFVDDDQRRKGAVALRHGQVTRRCRIAVDVAQVDPLQGPATSDDGGWHLPGARASEGHTGRRRRRGGCIRGTVGGRTGGDDQKR